MGHPSYKAGVRLEYKIMKLLKDNLPSDKFTVIRTAGSHSPVDVFVIEHIRDVGRKRDGFGIQCKTKKLKKKNHTKNE